MEYTLTVNESGVIEIEKSNHWRVCLAPGDYLSGAWREGLSEAQISEIETVIVRVWTPEVIEAYQAVIAQNIIP